MHSLCIKCKVNVSSKIEFEICSLFSYLICNFLKNLLQKVRTPALTIFLVIEEKEYTDGERSLIDTCEVLFRWPNIFLLLHRGTSEDSVGIPFEFSRRPGDRASLNGASRRSLR